MYVLYADSPTSLSERSQLFEQYMEPLLRRLEAASSSGSIPASIPEIPQYLQVCRWPFRKLEYSFALDALINKLKPGDRFLDAGSGATPLAHAVAALHVQAEACDGNAALINKLQGAHPESIYGTQVSYSHQDLTKLSFPDASFDAVSCISVLEHIPAPQDQQALREMLRILKPGGILVLTIDFTPAASSSQARAGYFIKRAIDLARSSDLAGVGQGFLRKMHSYRAVSSGLARLARSANQCFAVDHIEQDLMPTLGQSELPSRLPFSTNLRSMTATHARHFWDLEAGLFDNQGRRTVLPAGYIGQKAATPQGYEQLGELMRAV
jgi:2-polyprenyl-3-methyl-5-hydroxy-6-metoxy-1,4-benzoquinol methylase